MIKVKRTESDPVGDGFSFDAQTSSVEVTRGERLRNFYEEYVYKPAIIAWDDMRTRIGALILSIYILMGTVGAWLYPRPELGEHRNLLPFENWEYPLGTTKKGVGVLAETIHATPGMLLMVLAGAVFATGIGVLIGTVAGYKGGLTDRVVTTFSDIAMAIPGLPIVMILGYGLQLQNPIYIGIIIMINYWAGLARTLRSEVLKLRESSYVEASRTMGVSTPKILTKDIIPSLMPYVLVNFAFAARYVVFASVGLYYLGILNPTVANWGDQLRRAYEQELALQVDGLLYLIAVPMIAIMGLALSLVLLAQGLDRLFNPRVRTRLAGESESIHEEEDQVTATGGI